MATKQELIARNNKKKQQLYTWLMIVQGLTIFLALFLIVVTYANWPALSAEFKYDWQSRVHPQPTTTPSATPTIPAVAKVTPAPTASPIIEAPHIIISKIGVDSPITWQVPADKTVDYLDKGVAHLAGSATLGQVGNLFITGHSSDYVWKHNPYAAVFALLPKLQPNDQIEIKENGKTYVYKVVHTEIVNPDNVQVTKPTTAAVLTLLTCYPVGSTAQRYVVQASLVSSPDPLTASSQTDSGTLPAIQFR